VIANTDGHRWLSLEDDDDAVWLFDVDFLMSNYTCIYGQGCPSISAEPDPTGTLGCCEHGAHFVDDEDHDTVLGYIDRLTPENWENHQVAQRRGGPTKQISDNGTKSWTTRTADGACILLNGPDFPGGAGCALHIAALSHDERPVAWKPSVCWQVPIRIDVHENDYGVETVMLRAWERRDWGGGGDDFHWWCTESDEAYVGSSPVYRSAREELVELLGEALYDRLVTHLDELSRQVSVTLNPVNSTPSPSNHES